MKRVENQTKVPMDPGRPRTTKNVYFFKSGDNSFGGVKLPVNLRRYRTVDALLDDLSGKIPGYSFGVRQLRTPEGRHQVTKLDELQHMGGYVCTEKYNHGRIPGVDFHRLKHPLEFMPHETFSNYGLPPRPNNQGSPKGKKKKVKKIRKKREQIYETTESVENEKQFDETRREDNAIRDFVNRAEDDEIDRQNQRRQSDLLEDDEEDGTRRNERQYDDFSTEENEQNESEPFGNPSFSAPGTPAERKKFDENPLAPLDNKRLKHVQRRRIATKQVKAEDYTLPQDAEEDDAFIPHQKSLKKIKKSSVRKKDGKNLTQRNSFDDRMRIDEYGTPQKERILAAEIMLPAATSNVAEQLSPVASARGRTAGTVRSASPNGKRSATPMTRRDEDGDEQESPRADGMRSVTPLDDGEPGSQNHSNNSRQENNNPSPQRLQSVHSRRTDRIRSAETAYSSRPVSAQSNLNRNQASHVAPATTVNHREMASLVQTVYAANNNSVNNGNPENVTPRENDQSPDGDRHEKDEAANYDDHDYANMQSESVLDNEVNEWHEFMHSVHEDHDRRQHEFETEENDEESQLRQNAQQREQSQNSTNPNESERRRREDEDLDEMALWGIGPKSRGASAKGVPTRKSLRPVDESRDTANVDTESWVDEHGTRRKSQFMIFGHSEDRPEEHDSSDGQGLHENETRLAEKQGQKHERKSSLRDSGVSSIVAN